MPYFCPRCGWGRLRPTRSTYVRRLGRRLVTAPNFAVWRCDGCGYSRYDRVALANIEILLGPEPANGEEPLERPTSHQLAGPADRGPQHPSS
ncbi:MAG: YgiT-type zinc finger protein [Anaerolineae bacterium]|nr:YgiT-type zinc finger protein [Anaerolineae bacterium]